jgi:chemotaxis methyl-accepting protein methylase
MTTPRQRDKAFEAPPDAADSRAAGLDDNAFRHLTSKISRERGFKCAHYKERCLRRRIAVRMRARGVHGYAEYARILDRDTAEYDKLLDTLTINVTKFFRNWPVYAVLQERVIPELWRLDTRRIRVWSAGCSSGEEAYSLGILFHKVATVEGLLRQIARVEIVGTDIDRESLAVAHAGRFRQGDFTDTPPDLRKKYFTAAVPHSVAPAIRRLVRFEQRDLLEDVPPAAPGGFHLITCRNVLIYFDRDTQERLFETFHRALAPGGVLVLGKVETLLGEARARFTPIDARERIFRRP